MTRELQKQRDELAIKYGVHIVDNFHSLGTYKQADFKAGFDAAVELMSKDIEALQAKLDVAKEENDRLRRIIAKELSENDGLGREFVYVTILLDRLDVAKKALKRIEKHGDGSLYGQIAEQALKEMEGGNE